MVITAGGAGAAPMAAVCNGICTLMPEARSCIMTSWVLAHHLVAHCPQEVRNGVALADCDLPPVAAAVPVGVCDVQRLVLHQLRGTRRNEVFCVLILPSDDTTEHGFSTNTAAAKTGITALPLAAVELIGFVSCFEDISGALHGCAICHRPGYLLAQRVLPFELRAELLLGCSTPGVRQEVRPHARVLPCSRHWDVSADKMAKTLHSKAARGCTAVCGKQELAAPERQAAGRGGARTQLPLRRSC